jgi:hypothetical protein
VFSLELAYEGCDARVVGNYPVDFKNDDLQTLCSGYRLLMHIVPQINFALAAYLVGWLLTPKVFLDLFKLLPLLLSNFETTE